MTVSDAVKGFATCGNATCYQVTLGNFVACFVACLALWNSICRWKCSNYIFIYCSM